MTDKREDREALIEEAAKAMCFEDCGVAALEDDAEPFREMARVALGVFEQAHTPTDDERELLAEADALVASWDLKGSWTSESPVGLVMRLAAALRRPVQGEPTDAQVRAVWDALGPGITVAFEYEELRTALRAATAVQGGENRG